jgi:hypothetical protein
MTPGPTAATHGRHVVAALAFLLPTAAMAQRPGTGVLDGLTRTCATGDFDGDLRHVGGFVLRP